MQIVDAFKAKVYFSTLLGRVEQGEEVVITRQGHPVARLIPARTLINREHIQHVVERLKEFSKSNKLGGLDWKTLRDEKRR